MQLTDLLPHRPPMLLLSTLLSWSQTAVRAQALVTRNMPFVRANGVLEHCAYGELLAQCLAAGAGAMGGPRSGYLAALRDIRVLEDAVCGDLLTIDVALGARVGEITCFSGHVSRGDTVLSTGSGKIYCQGAVPC